MKMSRLAKDLQAISTEVDPDISAVSLERVAHDRRAAVLMWNELWRHPRSVGSLFPSSRYLADRIAASVDPGEEGFVVELGAGTGSITAALLRRGVPAQKLIVIEKSLQLHRFLKTQFPGICVIHGDAADIPPGQQLTGEVAAVISCLPLRSLPPTVVHGIATRWTSTLKESGRVVQFTYAPFRSSAWRRAGLTCATSSLVWSNFPPARVEMFNPISTTRNSS
jgi:phosphatidylethanolamine/phosphatidyl-N-methylethanolamine N-methyltransferase